MKSLIIYILIGCITLLGCTENNHSSDQKNATHNQLVSKFNIQPEIFNPQGVFDKDDVKSLIDSNIIFTFELLEQLYRADKQNIVISPSSVNAAISQVYIGALNNTAEEIKAVMKYKIASDEFAEAFGHYQKQQMSKAQGYKLKVVNGVFVENTYPWSKVYENTIMCNYPNPLLHVDFRRNWEQERQRINSWIYHSTQKKFNDFLSSEDIGPKTTFIITSICDFKGFWNKAFNKQMTFKRSFEISKVRCIDVDMMQATDAFKYLNNDFAKMVEIPYKNDSGSLVIILPHESVEGLLPHLKENYSHWIADLKMIEEVDISLPRVDLNSEFELKDILISMGMKLLWDPSGSDLSGMINLSELKKRKDPYFETPLYANELLHRARIKWDEESTEGTAVAVVAPPSLGGGPPFIQCNRPFVFVVINNNNDISFAGIVKNPASN